MSMASQTKRKYTQSPEPDPEKRVHLQVEEAGETETGQTRGQRSTSPDRAATHDTPTLAAAVQDEGIQEQTRPLQEDDPRIEPIQTIAQDDSSPRQEEHHADDDDDADEPDDEASIDPEALAQIRALLEANPQLGLSGNDQVDPAEETGPFLNGQDGDEEASLADIQKALDAALAYSAHEDQGLDELGQTPSDLSKDQRLAGQQISEGLRALLSLHEPESSSAAKEQASRIRPDPSTAATGSDDNVFPCRYPNCNKTFDRYYNLKSHQTSHVEERPYRCHVCPMTFTRNHDLKRHVKIHTEAKAFKCLGCDHSFSRLDALRRHKLNPKSDQACQTTPVAKDEEALALSQQLAEQNAVIQEDLRLQVEKGIRVDQVPKSSLRGPGQYISRPPGAPAAAIAAKAPGSFMGLGMSQLQSALKKALFRLGGAAEQDGQEAVASPVAKNEDNPSEKISPGTPPESAHAGATTGHGRPPVLSENLVRQLAKVLASAIARAGAQQRVEVETKGRGNGLEGQLPPTAREKSPEPLPINIAAITAAANAAAAHAADRKRAEAEDGDDDDAAAAAAAAAAEHSSFQALGQEGIALER